MPKKNGHAYHELEMMVAGYGERGICTLLYWRDGTVEEVAVKPAAMVKRIAEHYGKTPQSVRKQWRCMHREKEAERFEKMAILVISPGIVLMPVKVAQEMVGRDPAIGYVNLAQPVRFLEEKDGAGVRSRIVFRESPHSLRSAWTCRTLRRHRDAALLFSREEERRHAMEMRIVERANVYLNWYEQ